jgi:ABC-type multidrug transport system fused ATPase/permease subunit
LQASFYGLMFFVVACAMLLSYTAMHACLGIMAQRMSKRLRVLVLGSILRQEVGWFDRWVALVTAVCGLEVLGPLVWQQAGVQWSHALAGGLPCRQPCCSCSFADGPAIDGFFVSLCREENSSGVLSSRLASDTVHVRGAVGDVFGLVALNGANLLFGFLIAYAYNWRMALVVTALLPVVALAGFYQMKFAFSAQGEVDGLYAGSNHAITEGLSSIRVIHAYNLQVRSGSGSVRGSGVINAWWIHAQVSGNADIASNAVPGP